MYCLPLSIPHIIVSSKQTIEREIELHVLTPFGHLDITFFLPPPEGNVPHRLDIQVKGNTTSWMLEPNLPPSFRKTIIGFVGRIALLYSMWPEDRPCELNICFGNNAGGAQLTGHLMLYASASAGG